jgi:hypothetical protein
MGVKLATNCKEFVIVSSMHFSHVGCIGCCPFAFLNCKGRWKRSEEMEEEGRRGREER